MFYGDPGSNDFITKILELPYRPHFQYWLLNILEQNRQYDQSFSRMLPRLREVLYHFFIKQWHDEASSENLDVIIEFVKDHFGIESLPENIDDNSKFPPVLKIRGLLHRDDTKLNSEQSK